MGFCELSGHALRQAASVETRLVEGMPADAILKLAAEARAGAIVMGTHGRTGYNRWMLGSVAERVLRDSPAPVLTVRREPERPIRHILCPVNDMEVSREALSVAAGPVRLDPASRTAPLQHPRTGAKRRRRR